MSFVSKELKLLKKGYIYVLGIGLLFSLYTIAIKLNFDHKIYIEGFLGATLALISADFIHGYGDEKIIISCTVNFISYLFKKFVIMLTLFFLILNVHSITIQLFGGAEDLKNFLCKQILLNVDCLVIFWFISSVSILTSYLTKTNIVAYGIGMAVFLLGETLYKAILQYDPPKWTWIFSLYGTRMIYPSPEWFINKILFFTLALSFWGVMYISYNRGKKDLV